MSVDEIFSLFEIEFDAGAEPVFHGGELVTGSLRVNLKQRVTINAIRLQFKGRSAWLAADASKHGAPEEKEKMYFDKDFVLLERPPGHPEPGHFLWNANFTYSLPFECPLPKGCPTSYESPTAFVRYYARCTIETDEQTQYLIKKAFTVVAPPELHHLLPPAEEAITRQDVATFGGCCCRGKISAQISLPKRAYAPGEPVVGTLSIDNRHPKNVTEQIEVRLVDRVKRAVEISSPVDVKLTESTITANDNATTIAPTVNGVDGATIVQSETKKEKKAAKKRIVKKYQKSDAPLIVAAGTHHKSKHSSEARVLFVRSLAKEDVTPSKESASQSDLHLLTIPPVPTSIVPDNADLDLSDQVSSLTSAAVADGRLSKLLESPSTATFRLRRQPFIRIEYALQISIGSHLTVEVPIDVHPIPIYANGIDFRPFAAGAQAIGEPDEAGRQAYHGPFTFTPLYPTYLAPPKPVKVLNSNTLTVSNTESTPTTVTPITEDLVNGVPQTTTTVKESTVQLPDGSTITDYERRHVTTTTTIITTPATKTPTHEVYEQQLAHQLVNSPIEITINNTTTSEQVEQPPQASENTIEEPQIDACPSAEKTVEQCLEASHIQDSNTNNMTEPTEEAESIIPNKKESVKSENVDEPVSNGIVDESNGVEIYANGHENDVTDQITENGVKVTEQTETEQEHLPNGHIVQTTTITRTTATKNDESVVEDLAEKKIIETTVEQIEYDENGVEVRKQNSTTKREQQQSIIANDDNNAIAVE